MIRVFISYAHEDEELRDLLEVHLKPLRRDGVIETWHDRRIAAGDEFAREIDRELERADVILLLVSPFFMASDYCHDVEMKRALERHEAGDARVIPVILDPCGWTDSLFGKLLAVPRDGKPVSKHANHHDAFQEVVTAIRGAAERAPHAKSGPVPTESRAVQLRPSAASGPRSSNLGIKKGFSDHQRDTFRNESFEYIANFFENSIDELARRHDEITGTFRLIDANTFTAALYRDGTHVSGCRVSMGGSVGDITYSGREDVDRGSFNEWLSVKHDGHVPSLEPGGMSMRRTSRDALTQQGAAEYLWEMFVERLQR